MPYLGPRNALQDAKDTLSSWDKCMAKTYCKWPVIVAIIVGSLIVLSVVFCVARCLCCGAECACCCFRCCAGCCGGGRKNKSMAQPPPPMPAPVYPAPSSYTPSEPARSYETRPLNQQYRSHATPAFKPDPDVPQYARFESTKPANEDALPAMPTWGEATSTHVEEIVMPEKRGDVEMDRLNHNGSVTGGQMTGVTGMPGPRRSPARSPVSREDSYGYSDPYQNDPYAAGAVPRRSPGPRSPPPNNYGHYAQQDGGYRGMSPVHAQSGSPVYTNGGMSPVHEQSRSPVYNNGGAAPIGAAYSQSPPPNQYRRSSDQLLNSYNYDLPDDNPYDAQPTAYGQAYTAPSPGPAPMGTTAGLPNRTTPPHANDSPYRVPSPPSNVVEMPYHSNPPRPTPPSLTIASPTARSQYTPLSPERANTTSPSYPGQQMYEAPEGGNGYPGHQQYQAFRPS